MNARISFQNRMSKKQQEVAREAMQEQFRKEAEGHTRRMLKIFCLAMNKKRGHGRQRLGEDLEMITQIANEHMYDTIFWYHADKALEQIGVPFIPEDYEELERRQK